MRRPHRQRWASEDRGPAEDKAFYEGLYAAFARHVLVGATKSPNHLDYHPDVKGKTSYHHHCHCMPFSTLASLADAAFIHVKTRADDDPKVSCRNKYLSTLYDRCAACKACVTVTRRCSHKTVVSYHYDGQVVRDRCQCY